MSGSNSNTLTNPAVSASGLVDSLLIEKFTGTVHQEYQKGENLLGIFEMNEVVGTNMITNKYMGDTELQVLTPGQSPEATPTEFDKNSLVVDTIVLGRSAIHTLHDLQNDFKTQEKYAINQMGKIKSMEDQMVVQQCLTGALTGGVFDPYAVGSAKIVGGTKRLQSQGVAINTEISNTQAQDPYRLVSALEITIMGLVIQKVPLAQMKIIVPIEEFGLLVDYGFIAQSQGGSGTGFESSTFGNMQGMLKGMGVPVYGSAEYSQMRMTGSYASTGKHHLLSKDSNSYRYDVTDTMVNSGAIILRKEGLLVGRTIAPTGDIYFDKPSKSYFIDSWLSEGAIPDRYDNLGCVTYDTTTNTAVEAKAKGKATLTKTVA